MLIRVKTERHKEMELGQITILTGPDGSGKTATIDQIHRDYPDAYSHVVEWGQKELDTVIALHNEKGKVMTFEHIGSRSSPHIQYVIGLVLAGLSQYNQVIVETHSQYLINGILDILSHAGNTSSMKMYLMQHDSSFQEVPEEYRATIQDVIFRSAMEALELNMKESNSAKD